MPQLPLFKDVHSTTFKGEAYVTRKSVCQAAAASNRVEPIMLELMERL